MTVEQRKSVHNDLNFAIFKVLTTQFKKDAKPYHELVEAFGYTIDKYDGAFRVKSKNRTISVQYVGRYNCDWHVSFGYYTTHQKDFEREADMLKFDFVNCLNTPINAVYYTLNQYDEGWGGINDVHAKYERIRDKLYNYRRDINWYEREVDATQKRIEDMQKKILELQKDMLRYNKNAVENKVKLDGLRKELGLA